VREQIGEAAERRHTAPVASVALWAVICGAAVVSVHAATARLGARIGSYWTGLATLIAFMLAAAYSRRKRSLWFSLRWLRLAMRLPRQLALRFVLLDRLETWRFAHISIGMLAILPFWWHVQAGRASTLELALKSAVVLLVLSGLLGASIEDFLPHAMRIRPDQEVRLEDVEASFNALYVEAEERILGHSEQLVHAYIQNVRPILTGNQPAVRMLWATLTGADPAPRMCLGARQAGADLSGDASVYGELVDIAERKVRLEHNQFNLQLSTRWLYFHMDLAAAVGLLVIFHVAGVLYFFGL
jgi:hypothetical protein